MKCAMTLAGANGAGPPDLHGGRTLMEDIARACSPRVEQYGDAGVIFDASGLTHVFGVPEHLAYEVQRLAAERHLTIRVAVAATTTAAWLLASHARLPVTVAAPGHEAAALAALPIDALLTVRDLAPMKDDVRRQRVARGQNFRAAPSPMRLHNTGYVKDHVQVLSTLSRWGIRTLGDLAALSRAELRARFGPLGTRMHEVALGEDCQPMVPGDVPRRFLERLELDWPIEGLEPLSFVLARLCESLSKQLEQADRGAVSITTRLALVSKAGFERTLHLPAPMRDPKVLRTLILLDLESNPIEQGKGQRAEGRGKGKRGKGKGEDTTECTIESSGVDVVELEVEVSPGRITQGALFVRTMPTPESLATLIARLGALMGEAKIGAPEIKDTDDDRDIGQQTFVVREVRQVRQSLPAVAVSVANALQRPVREGSVREVRQVRGSLPAVAVSVANALQRPVREGGALVREVPALRRLRRPKAIRMASFEIVAKAGPWRSSGKWWRNDGAAWDRDGWDMELTDGRLVRVSRNRLTNNWELDGTYD
jgi:protein ImuB